jgi:hypothetical protein
MSEERICMELKIDKKFIDETVQKAVKDIKQNYIPKDVLDKIRAEIAEYGSIMVAYAITEDTKTDKGIEKLVSDVLSEAKRQVLDIIDKYKAESEATE